MFMFVGILCLMLLPVRFNIKSTLNAPLLLSYPCVTFNKLSFRKDVDDDNNLVVIVDPAESEVFNFNVARLSLSIKKKNSAETETNKEF